MDELSSTVSKLPGKERADAEVLAIEYMDARGADGCARKFRVMMIGGKLYPLHLAVSGNWKVHYFSAEMADCPEHRSEEAEFLAEMPKVVGGKGMRALTQLLYGDRTAER
jgi:hypothetical protein